MENRLKLSVLLTSPLISSLSLSFKSQYWSPLASIFCSFLFLPLGLFILKTSKDSQRSSLKTLLKFLILGSFSGYQACVFQDFDFGAISGLLMISSFSSIFLSLGISCYSLTKGAELRYPWLFSFSSLSVFQEFIDTFAVIIVSESCGFGISIYLGFAFLSTRWIYSNFYMFFIWTVGFTIVAWLFSDKITGFILTRQKPNVYKY
jgi:hypothetical protein